MSSDDPHAVMEIRYNEYFVGVVWCGVREQSIGVVMKALEVCHVYRLASVEY